MKLFAFCKNEFKPVNSRGFSRVLFFSTESQTSKSKVSNNILHNEVFSVIDEGVSIVPILDKWNQQGKHLSKIELQCWIKELRHSKRFKHALQMSEWMSNWKFYIASSNDDAVRLGLISTVHGIEEAEKYFTNLPKKSKLLRAYEVLLESYTQNKSVQKANPLMGQMRKLGFLNSTGAYNSILNFYANVGQYEKLDTLLEEMNVQSIRPDKTTFSVCLTAYEATSDINGVENILHKIDSNPEIVLDWTIYTTAGNTYIKVGLIDKALQMLKKSEELIPRYQRRDAYDSLIKLYASIGRKDDIYRIWNLYKSSGKVFTIAYHCMITSLLKVDDIVGAEKILEEWESSNTLHDKDPKSLIPAYLENDLLEKAMKKGMKPYQTTYEILASAYIASNLIPKAIHSLKAAFLLRRPGWKPVRDTLAACLIYMKEQGDAEDTKEFVKLLGVPTHMSTDDWEKLLDYFYDSKAEVGKVSEINADYFNGDGTEISKEAT